MTPLSIHNLRPCSKRLLIAGGAAVLVAAGAFAWWTLSPLLFNVEVSEAVTESEQPLHVQRSGSFQGADRFHQASGTAQFIDRQTDRIVRFEADFEVTNGPDLFVWLVRDLDTIRQDHIDLGTLKGNIGSQNYVVPEGVDVREYDTVVIWCRAFGVLFGSADLAAEAQPAGLQN